MVQIDPKRCPIPVLLSQGNKFSVCVCMSRSPEIFVDCTSFLVKINAIQHSLFKQPSLVESITHSHTQNTLANPKENIKGLD